MNFRNDDIESILYCNGGGPAGTYDQMNWKVRSGADATHITSQVVTVHEFMHNELNNTTAYGFLLQSYAYLSRENTALRGQFACILNELVERCRTSHELYATWSSINLLSADVNDQLHQELLRDNEPYLYYYNSAAHMVELIPDLYLQRHVVTAVVNICFQSQAITKLAAEDLVAFDPDTVSISEYPDLRLDTIRQYFKHTDWMDLLLEFAETQQQLPWYNLLQDALLGKGDDKRLSLAENESNSEVLIKFVYDRVAVKLNSLGLPSLPFREHLAYFTQLLPLLDRLAPFSQSSNPLVLNTKPDDITRSVLQNFENETLLFTNRPLTAILLHPTEMSAKSKAQILGGIGEYPHIFVTGRTYHFLKEQYIFPEKVDVDWCEHQSGSFVAIRYAGYIDGKRLVVYVPFSDPEELDTFLENRTPGIPVLGAVAESSCCDTDWWKQWGDFFSGNCVSSCILLDISPLHYIEQIFPDASRLLYRKADISMGEKLKSCMLFQVRHEEQTVAVMVAPCSEIYARGLHHYMQTRFPLFEHRLDLSQEDLQNIPVILSHVFREEHMYYYRSKT